MEEHSTSFWVAFLVGLALGGAIIRDLILSPSKGIKPEIKVNIMETEKW